MKPQEDRRVRRTRRILREVLVEELQSQELQKITVKNICAKADINRSTFYLHYSNVFDLWNSIEQEILGSMNEILSSFKAKAVLTKPLPLLLEITGYLENESILNRKFFQCRESIILLDKIKDGFVDFFLKNSSGIIRPENIGELNLYITFVMSGTISLFYKWFLGEIDISLNKLAHEIEHLITGGVEDFLNDFRIDR
ncbi:MAG: TetR/AcrR family transcriptional regulator [Spirochaetales bacterium]|nr:TetR/AcrR family transcriptional regulator [Spirochaetales bacterium]